MTNLLLDVEPRDPAPRCPHCAALEARVLSPVAIEAGAKALAFVGLSPHDYPDPDATWANADAGGKQLFRDEYCAAITAAIAAANGDLTDAAPERTEDRP